MAHPKDKKESKKTGHKHVHPPNHKFLDIITTQIPFFFGGLEKNHSFLIRPRHQCRNTLRNTTSKGN